MRVFLFSPISMKENGGAELYLLHLAAALHHHGHETQLQTGLPFYHLGRWHQPTPDTRRKLKTYMKWADFVYCSYGYVGYDWILTQLSRETRTPVIAGHHAPVVHADRLHNLWMYTFGRLLLHQFSGHHVLNRDHGRLLKQWGIKRVFYAPCGIDRDLFSPGKRTRPHKTLRFLFIGRRSPQKGLDVLEEAVEAMSSAERRRFEVRILTGSTPHREIPSHIAWADVVIVPSREETSPAVVLEALASGRPVLGSDIPAIRAMVTPGKDGWLVTVGSSPAIRRGLAMVVSLLSRNPRRWREMGDMARKATEQYDHRLLFTRLIRWMEAVAKNVKRKM